MLTMGCMEEPIDKKTDHLKRRGIMLRMGVLLFLVSTVAVILRYMEVAGFVGPTVKVLCYISLTASVGFFMATYLATELVGRKGHRA